MSTARVVSLDLDYENLSRTSDPTRAVRNWAEDFLAHSDMIHIERVRLIE